jgi:hypothetical protein
MGMDSGGNMRVSNFGNLNEMPTRKTPIDPSHCTHKQGFKLRRSHHQTDPRHTRSFGVPGHIFISALTS